MRVQPRPLIVIPVALGAVFLAVATSHLGWWGPAIREALRAPRWLWAVPALMVLPGLGSLLGGIGPADRAGSQLLALGVGTLLVGFSEVLCKLLHPWNDFTTFAFSDAATDAESPFVILGFAQWIAFILAIVGVVLVLRRGSTQENEVTTGAHAAI